LKLHFYRRRLKNRIKSLPIRSALLKKNAITILLGALLLLGCSKHGQSGGSGNGTSSADEANRLPGTAPWSGHVLRGDDANALRSYLRSVQEIKATVFEVQWNPATVAIDREAAIRSLRRVSRDGVTFVFAANEPTVGKLKPGSIMWVRDLALRKVDAVDTQGGLTTVQTSIVSLNEAMPNAHIEFEAPVPVQNFLLSHPEAPATPASPKTSSLVHGAYGFVPVLYTVPPVAASGPSGHSAGSPTPGSTPGSGASPSPGPSPGAGAPNAGSAPGGGAPNPGSAPGGGAPNSGSAPGGGAPNSGSAPGGGAPNSGSAPGGGAPNSGSAPGGGAPNSGSAPGGGAPNPGSAPGGGAPNPGSAPGGGAPNPGSAPGGGAPNPGDAPGSGGDPANQNDEQSFGDNAYSGSLNGMLYSIGYRPLASGALNVALESRDGEDGGDGGKGFKHYFDMPSDNVDVRFKVNAELSGFSAAGAYQIVGGNVAAAKMQFKNLNGHVTAAFVGRLGHPGNKGLKVPIMHLPISFNVPLPIEGIPFVVQLGGDFLLTLFLAGNHATLSVNGAYNFNGQSGFSYANNNAGLSDTSNFTGAQPAVTNYQGASLGVSAVMLAAQLPRIGFGLSVTGAASTIAYFDVVHVLTMTQSADAGAMMLAPRCKRITYNALGHVGVETKVLLLPIPAVQQWASDKLTGKREVFNQSKEVLDPPVKGCEIN
jgi:hypothetical protein